MCICIEFIISGVRARAALGEVVGTDQVASTLVVALIDSSLYISSNNPRLRKPKGGSSENIQAEDVLIIVK